MPRVPDGLVDSVVCLYPSFEAATAGESLGGSGFLVGIPIAPTPTGQWTAVYAVTNSHVIREGNSPVVRINTKDGRFDVIDRRGAWIHHPDGDDVAIAPAGIQPTHKYVVVMADMLLERSDLDQWKVGPGDDVFFIGRFKFQEGIDQNVPVVRTGNLAVALPQPVTHPTRGIKQESFVVEARSLSGFSGSLVGLLIAPFAFRGIGEPTTDEGHLAVLGIDWGHVPDVGVVRSRVSGAAADDGTYVELNSGIMNVVPAWKLAELLHLPELEAARIEEGRRFKG